MYFRKFDAAPEKIIENGKANFGTFTDTTQKISIKGMKAPYAGIPFPSFITNLRIKSHLNYIYNLDKYIGIVDVYDFKIFSLLEIIFWNKKTGKKTAYHSYMGLRYRSIPNKTTKGMCVCYNRKRNVKISWSGMHQHNALSFKIKGDSVRPNTEGFIYSNISDDMHSDMLFVNPAPTSSRCSATWLSTMKVNGHIRFAEDTEDSTGIAAMLLNRTYYKLLVNSNRVWGIGTVNNKNIVFHLDTTNLDAVDSDKYNNNVLIVDGKKTALPSVVMTHPFGDSKKWVIQDTESMVDLTFIPSSVNSRILNLIVLHQHGKYIYGTFEGVLLDSKGNKIVLKNFPGIINRNSIRL